MRITTLFILSFYFLTTITLAQCQNDNVYNNTAVQNGNWGNCETWNRPAYIQNSSQYEKTILKDVQVVLNRPLVYAKKITLEDGSRIDLSNNKISFDGTGTPMVCSNECYIDNVLIDFSKPTPTNSMSGFIQGMARSDDIPPFNNPVTNHPTNDAIFPLKPKLLRQWDANKYKRSNDLSGRVHMVLSDNWRYWYENYYIKYQNDSSSGVAVAENYDFLPNDIETYQIYNDSNSNNPVGSIQINGPANYNNYLDRWFYWGTHDVPFKLVQSVNAPNTPIDVKPNIIWECWNEPDWEFMRTTHLIWDQLTDEDFIKTWPFRQDYFKIYKMFYNKIKNYPNIHDNGKALVAGPSLARYSEEKMKSFLDYCVRENLKVNVVTWHELYHEKQPSIASTILKNIQSFRNLLASGNYKNLDIESIEINEIVTDIYKDDPAAVASYLGALEKAKVNYAAKSCWRDMSKLQSWPNSNNPIECEQCDSAISQCPIPCVDNNNDNVDDCPKRPPCEACNSNSFLHLFTSTPEPDNDNKKKSNWWVYKLYSDGVNNRVLSTNNNERSVVLASKIVDTPEEVFEYKAQVLFGYSDKRESGALANNGTYRMVLKNISAALPGITSQSNLKIRIKILEDHGTDRNAAEGEYYGDLNELSPFPLYFDPSNQSYQISYNSLYYTDNDSLILKIENINKENLYQLTISTD